MSIFRLIGIHRVYFVAFAHSSSFFFRWSMAFGSSGMGMAANWVSAAAKGKAAAVRVFELFDRRPPIDSKPWNEDGSPRDMVVPSDVGGKKGEIEFRNVKFAYP